MGADCRYNQGTFMNWRLLIPAALALQPGMLLAATGSQPATPKYNLIDLFLAGGPVMYPLTLASIVGLVLVLLYVLTVRRGTVVSDRFMNTAEALIRKRDFLGLVAYCHRQNQSIARITQRFTDFLTKNSNVPFSEIREVAQAEGSRQASMLSQRISYLADIGAVAPMLGLLGTVTGMIKSFLEISVGNSEGVRQMKLASGVSEALIATAYGLMIGIPALVCFSFFRGRVQKYIAELEAAATHLLALVNAQLQPPPQRATRTATRGETLRPTAPGPFNEDHRDLHGI